MQLKRTLILCALLAASVSVVSAESYFGVKGIFRTNLGSELADNNGFKNVTMIGGGGSVYAGFNFLFFLGLHTELGFTANNGAKGEIQGQEVGLRFSTIDIPICLTARVPIGPVHVMAMIGPNFSFPVGDVKGVLFDNQSPGSITSKCIVGILGGAEAGLALGPGSLVLGVRYLSDLQDFKVESVKALVRRSFDVTLGYEFRF